MKGFFYDTLLEEENICNMEREKSLLRQGVSSGKKLIVYGPRNFGKTSIVKNVIIPHFRRENRKNFVLFADLMEVKSLDSIHRRIQTSFREAFGRSFPAKTLLQEAKSILAHLRPEISLDPLTHLPSLSLGVEKERGYASFLELFQIIRDRIAPKLPTLIVLDEFQDIAFVPEAQGLFRQALQEFKESPMILMGSKRHILSNIFAKPNAPLASFGEDIEFNSIPFEEYHRYIQERFDGRNLSLGLEDAILLQKSLHRVPEAINMVCAHLYERYKNKDIHSAIILESIRRVIETRRSRYEEWLSHFSEKEEEILIAIGKMGRLKEPTGKKFLKQVSSSQRTVSLVISRFLDKSILERESDGDYRLADPLLFWFVREFR